MKGRALWQFNGDPRQLMQYFQLPDTSPGQLRAWQIYQGLIDRNAGGTIAEGQPGRNMPRAGGAVNNLVSLAMADTEDVASLIEQEVMTPSLADIFYVSGEFIPDDQLIRIPGAYELFGDKSPKVVLRKQRDLIGDFEFDWVGSLQFQDDSVRAQRLMVFLSQMPILAPMLQQQGFMFNVVDLVKMIWRYGLGERGLSKVVIPIPGGPPPAPVPGQETGPSSNGAAKPTAPNLGPTMPSVTSAMNV